MTFKMKRGKYYRALQVICVLPFLLSPFYVDFTNIYNVMGALFIIVGLLHIYNVQESSTISMNENSLVVHEEYNRLFEYENMSDINICDTKGISIMYAPRKVSFQYLTKGKMKKYEVSPENVETFYKQLQERTKLVKQA